MSERNSDFSEPVLRLNSASEKRASCSPRSNWRLYVLAARVSKGNSDFREAVLRLNSASEKKRRPAQRRSN
ncbi:hypothetical protein TNCV_697771 [Trichonephila clavipes]|nr:hypothetical protein TNCV_697771 [Trichonephila clavipes]